LKAKWVVYMGHLKPQFLIKFNKQSYLEAFCVNSAGVWGHFFQSKHNRKVICPGMAMIPSPWLGPSPRLIPVAGPSHLLFILVVQFSNGPGDDDGAGDACKDRHGLQQTDGQGLSCGTQGRRSFFCSSNYRTSTTPGVPCSLTLPPLSYPLQTGDSMTSGILCWRSRESQFLF
jgi:hypothetical protein